MKLFWTLSLSFIFFHTSISQNITAVSSQDTLCFGESATLSTEGDAVDLFLWSPPNWISDVASGTPMVTPATTTTYTVVGTIFGDNVISNGDFESGNTGFTTDYLYGPNTGGGTWGPLSDEGTYAVSSNPNSVHTNFFPCNDHTGNFGNMMIINGTTTANENIWCQNITVVPNTIYLFSTWVATVFNENPAELQFSINGNLLGDVFEAPNTTCNWVQFFETWNSGNNTSIEICIVNQNIGQSGNDFAIDDISFAPVLQAQSSVTVYVSNISVSVPNQTDLDCDGNAGSASVAVNGGFEPYGYLWDNGETTAMATNLSVGSHTVTVTDVTGCSATANVEIFGPQPVVIDIVEVDHTTCNEENGSLEIFPGSGQGPFLFSINGMDFQESASFTNLTGGSYTAVAMDALGCEGTFDVVVNPSESVSFVIDAVHGTDLCGELPIVLDAGDFESFAWSTGETENPITVTEDGEYFVTVTDSDGCEGIANIAITDCEDWSMPNVFTPDNDGTNDEFGPVVNGGIQIVQFKVFNRWGNVVHNDKTPWNGEWNGQPHPSDVLIYHIVVETKDGIQEEKGDVTLIR